MADFDPQPHLAEVVRFLDSIMGSPSTPDHPVLVSGKLVLFRIEVQPGHLTWTPEERKTSSWRGELTGRTRLVVAGVPTSRDLEVSEWSGPRPEYRSFTPLKDGTYRYQEIAERLHGWMELYASWWKQEKAKESNRGLIGQLRNELGRLPPGMVIEESGSAERPVTIRLSKSYTLTEAETRALVPKLRRIL